MRFAGTVYRAHNPRWSFDPLSGMGAAAHGGRFNRPGRAALYLSTSIETAIREAAQSFSAKIDPLTIVSYEADFDAVVDLSSAATQQAARTTESLLAGPWKFQAARGEAVHTWDLAERLVSADASGILVPSFLRNSGARDLNLVLWDWGPDLPRQLLVHDPERRLPKNQASWE